MARTKISEFSATPASNTDIDSINIAEGCAPSGINDAIRELMAQLKDFQTGAVGDSFNGPVGTTTAAAGAFTTLTTTSTINNLTVGRGAGAVSSNTAVGASALATNSTGGSIVAVGDRALNLNTANNNTALGALAGYVNSTGTENAFLGRAAGFANTTGGSNTAVGNLALNANTTASNNTAVGYQAGYSNTTGTSLVAVGRMAMLSNTTGGDNSALGINALYTNTTGGSNTAIGSSALFANTTASNNTAIGYQAGYTNSSTGTSCTFLGYQAGYTSNAIQNTMIGASAGLLTTGNYNTFLGSSAGYNVSSGTKNTIVGRYDGNFGGLDIRTASNYIVLSDGDGNPRGVFDSSGNLLVGATSTINNAKTVIGFTSSNNGLYINETSNTSGTQFVRFNQSSNDVGSITRVGTTSAVTYNTTSDYRLKTVVGAVSGSGDRIDALTPIDYQWKEDNSQARGFLAHEFQAVYPNSVTGGKDDLDSEGNPIYQSMQASSSEVIADLVAEIQSLRKRLANAGL